jgi:hypothetical protein
MIENKQLFEMIIMTNKNLPDQDKFNNGFNLKLKSGTIKITIYGNRIYASLEKENIFAIVCENKKYILNQLSSKAEQIIDELFDYLLKNDSSLATENISETISKNIEIITQSENCKEISEKIDGFHIYEDRVSLGNNIIIYAEPEILVQYKDVDMLEISDEHMSTELSDSELSDFNNLLEDIINILDNSHEKYIAEFITQVNDFSKLIHSVE